MPASWLTLPNELQIRILRYALLIFDERPREIVNVPQLNLNCLQINSTARRLSIGILEREHYFMAFEMLLCERCGESMRGYMHECALQQSHLIRGLMAMEGLQGVSKLQVTVQCDGCELSVNRYPIWLLASETVEALSIFQLVSESWNSSINFRPTISFTSTITNPRIGSRIAAYPEKLLNVVCIDAATEKTLDSEENGIRKLEIKSTVPAGQPTRRQVLEIGSRWLNILQNNFPDLPRHQLAHTIEECCSRFDDWTQIYREEVDYFALSSPNDHSNDHSMETIYFRLLSLYFSSQANRLLQADNTLEDQNFLSIVDELGEKDLRSRVEQAQMMITSQPAGNWDNNNEYVEAAYDVIKQRTELYLALARTASLSTNPDWDLFMRAMSWTRFCIQGLAFMYIPRAQAIKLHFDSKIRPFLSLSPPRGPRYWRFFPLKPYWWGKPPIELITRAKKGIAWNEKFSKEHPHLQEDFLKWRADIRVRIKTMELMIHESSKRKRPIP